MKSYSVESVLSIAGSDSSGGAGIQADIKTIEAMGLFAQTAVTALTAQNTLGVSGVLDIDPDFVKDQIDAVFSDIRPDAVKIGMVSQPGIIDAIADSLAAHGAQRVVVDPVMVATSGASLIGEGARCRLVERLLPLADVITPNLPEAECLWGAPIESKKDMEEAAFALAQMAAGSAVLIKGGHRLGSADDLLLCEGRAIWLEQERIDNPNTHGTGCTLSSAIAVGLAQGMSVPDAVRLAKAYVTGAIGAGFSLGKGSGPLDHMWRYR